MSVALWGCKSLSGKRRVFRLTFLPHVLFNDDYSCLSTGDTYGYANHNTVDTLLIHTLRPGRHTSFNRLTAAALYIGMLYHDRELSEQLACRPSDLLVRTTSIKYQSSSLEHGMDLCMARVVLGK